MASWGDLVAYMRNSYDVIRYEPDEVRIRVSFAKDDEDILGRRQIMVVAHEILDQQEDWVQIATPFARLDQVDLREVLAEVGDTIVVGGVALMGDYVVLRHSLPLVNLDINEFTDPLDLVASGAEQLERRFTGRDDY
ncbi:type III secretion system chaperone family protein [Actinophytocola sediminis]